MFEYTDVSRLDAAGALGVLEQAQQTRRQAEVQEALAMLQMVKTYRHQIPTDKVQLAAEGTGLIDDFACLELAAALHRSLDSVTPQVVELLNLETRLPRLWETVVACGVPLWLARRIARTTAELTLAKALWLDATIAPFTTRLAHGRLLRFVEALVVQADPAAAEARWAARNRPRIEIGAVHRDGLRDIYGWLDAADATYLDAALEQLSAILARQGSTQDATERRATALGILATPARALALIQQSINQPALTDQAADEHPTGSPGAGQDAGQSTGQLPFSTVLEEAAPGDIEPVQPSAGDDQPGHGPRSPFGCPGHVCGAITVDPNRLAPKATLIIHLSDDTLTTGAGIGRCDQLGPVTVQQIKTLLGHHRVEVQPVFNPNGITPVDSYEIPASIRRAVLLRHPGEIFPYGTRHSAGLDLDHTKPFDHGPDAPPGQTRPDNLGPLRRKAHRGKTHAGWRLTQPEPGHFTWVSPLGLRYTVTPAGITNDHQHPPGTRAWDHPLGGPLLPDPPHPRHRRRAATRRQRTRPSAARAVMRR